MNQPSDPYAAMRQEQDAQAPYLLTATHKAILDEWRRLAVPVWRERDHLRVYRTADGHACSRLGQLREDQAQTLLTWLRTQPTANPQWHAEATP
jgi:hypothetical protein